MNLIDYFYPSPEKQSDSSSPELLPPIVAGRAETVRRALDVISHHHRVIGLNEADGMESSHIPPEATNYQEAREPVVQTPEAPRQIIDTSPASQQMTTKDIARLQEYIQSIAQEGITAQEGTGVIKNDFGGMRQAASSAGSRYDQEAA